MRSRTYSEVPRALRYVPEYIQYSVARLDYVSEYVRNFVARGDTLQNTCGISSRAEVRFRIRSEFRRASRLRSGIHSVFRRASRLRFRIRSEFRRAPKYVSEYVRNFVARRSTFQNTFGISSRAEVRFRIRSEFRRAPRIRSEYVSALENTFGIRLEYVWNTL